MEIYRCMQGDIDLRFASVNITLHTTINLHTDYIIKSTVVFCWKNVSIFCFAKVSYIFPTKHNSGFVIFMF